MTKHESRRYKVFISYRRKDLAFKDVVYNILKDAFGENSIFLDQKDLFCEPNQWADSLNNALCSSEYIVVCINDETFNRETVNGKTDWYYKEIEIALERQKEEGTIRIIPVINNRPNFDETKFPMLAELQDVCYQSLGEQKFRENLLKMVGYDCKIEDKENNETTITNNVYGNQYNFGDINGGTQIFS